MRRHVFPASSSRIVRRPHVGRSEVHSRAYANGQLLPSVVAIGLALSGLQLGMLRNVVDMAIAGKLFAT